MRLALVVTSALSCLHCQGGAGSSSTGEGSSGAAASTGGSATQDPSAGSSGSETAAPPTTGGETTALPTTGGESSGSGVGETGGSTTDDPPPECSKLLKATVRDFSQSHPDFEDYLGAQIGLVVGQDGKTCDIRTRRHGLDIEVTAFHRQLEILQRRRPDRGEREKDLCRSQGSFDFKRSHGHSWRRVIHADGYNIIEDTRRGRGSFNI